MTFSKDKMSSWIKEGIPITTTENSNLFCDQNIYQDVLNAKVRSLEYSIVFKHILYYYRKYLMTWI